MGDQLIVDCRNLIGDTIYLIKPLKQFLACQRFGQVALGVNRGLPAEIVQRSFLGVRVGPLELLEAAWPGADRVELSARLAWQKTRPDNSHISQGYARILGMELIGGIEPDLSWLPPPDAALRPEYIALAPFSVSCARHRGEPPNKTINEKDWVRLLEIVRGYGWPLRIIGGPEERFSMPALGFSEADYFSAGGIEELVSCLRRSWLVIGVDTGVCHVSSCAGIPTIVLWSAASLQFIGETWAPRTRIVHIGNPVAFDVHRVAGLLADATKLLLGGDAPAAAVSGAGNTATGDPTAPLNDRPIFPVLDSLTFTPPPYGAPGLSNWSGHLPFAHDLVASLRPRLLVEIGTRHGESYFGFCHSVVEAGCRCACYAVCGAIGDPHSLAGDEAVQDHLRRYNSEHYASFSQVLQTSFDDALEWFPEGYIDLLHIDGLRTYEAVKHDFETWYPKVAPGGIVLLRDIAAGAAGFGVRRFWEEVSQAYDTFAFHHCSGLGVIRKPGGPPVRQGILDYLFLDRNAGPVRRYYVSCSERLDRRADAVAATQSAHGPAVVDPPAGLIGALTDADDTDGERRWIELPLADPGLLRNDSEPSDQKPNTWRASTPDPWIAFSTDLNCANMRFFVLTMSCRCQAPQPFAQLFWSGLWRPGFNELLSVRFPVIPDGQPHTYVVDLHAGAEPSALNYLWWHQGSVDNVRLDPMDRPGEFTIHLAGFAHRDCAESDDVRDSLRLPPLRTELADRYLRGKGIEIGTLPGPLELRPDTHVRHANCLTSAAQSLDFVVANHVLEHVPNPLASLAEWLQALRPWGHAYVAVPDHKNPSDSPQPVTPVDRLVAGFERLEPPNEAGPDDNTLPDLALHAFSRASFAGFLREAIGRFPAELIELHSTSEGGAMEHIAILCKLGEIRG